MKTLSRRMSNMSNRQVFMLLILLAFVTSLVSYRMTSYGDALGPQAWWGGWLQNFSTEMLGAVVTFWLIELIVSSRQEKDKLVRQMASNVREVAVPAVTELRAHGWLENGALDGKDFTGANLQGVDLEHASLVGAHMWHVNLQQAKVWYADMRNARLWFANLKDADLTGCNLQGATFMTADIRSANLSRCHLQGVSFAGADLMGANFGEYVSSTGSQRFGSALKDSRATLDETTILPDNSPYDLALGLEQLARFTDPAHPDFWNPETDQGKHRGAIS